MRTIVISFKDNEAAELFCKLQVGEVLGATETMRDQLVELAFLAREAKLDAMIARPTASCRCTKGFGKMNNNNYGWTRTLRFGWWVHAACKKPSRYVVRDFIRNMIIQNNDLLPELFSEHDGQPAPVSGGNEPGGTTSTGAPLPSHEAGQSREVQPVAGLADQVPV